MVIDFALRQQGFKNEAIRQIRVIFSDAADFSPMLNLLRNTSTRSLCIDLNICNEVIV